jgi:hypothetical protein
LQYSNGQEVKLLDEVVISDGLSGSIAGIPSQGLFAGNAIKPDPLSDRSSDLFAAKFGSGVFVMTNEVGLVYYSDVSEMRLLARHPSR